MYPMEVGKEKGEKTRKVGTELSIKLKVDAAELYSKEHPSREDLNACCELTDSNPNTPEVKNIEHFESWVKPGQQVRWEAESNDQEGDFEVTIESVVYAHYKKNELDDAREENFFNAIAICSSDDNIVRAKVKDIKESGDFVHIYNLNFNIRKGGVRQKSYSIDPRLKMVQ